MTPTDLRVAAFRVASNNCVFRGFEVVGVRITIADRLTQSEAFRVDRGNGNLFENLAIHDGQAIGWYLVSGSDNRVHNVDAYNNRGLNAFSDGNIDGFGVHPTLAGSSGNLIEGSRAWFNSDDGFDLINAAAAVTLQRNWSFYNGYDSRWAMAQASRQAATAATEAIIPSRCRAISCGSIWQWAIDPTASTPITTSVGRSGSATHRSRTAAPTTTCSPP
nr:right-handed parallel beta-helix repeat-containing protein [Xanthomonas campestris]